MRNFSKLLILLPVILWLLSGCAGYHIENGSLDGFTKYTANIADGTALPAYREAAEKNSRLLKEYRDIGEWQFNNDKNAPPRLGIALSGGGMRAGTVALGVLMALNDAQILDQNGKTLLDIVDVISSVSGGGYAASWFFSQLHYARDDDPEKTFKDLFDPKGKYQQYLEEHGELIGHTGITPLRRLEYLKGGLTILSQPLNLFENGIFGWHTNTNPGRKFYEHGINRTWNYQPPDGYNGPSILHDYFSGSKEDISFPVLANFLTNSKHRLPYWIINTTANIDDNMNHYGSSLGNTVFEFTPLHFGSNYFRYWGTKENPADFPFEVHRAVAVSGAAVDSYVTTGSATKILASAFNFDLGYYITNPDPHFSFGDRFLHDILPFPFYLLHHYNKDGDGLKIYLTDGGQSENLGAYSLVKRLCDIIVIVDAEHDPDYQFGAYKVLKAGIKKDMGADLNIPAIENVINGKASFDWTSPVMTGAISFFPIMDGPKPRSKDLQVYYLKLSIDKAVCKSRQNCDTKYGEYVGSYYENGTLHKDTYGQFPQQSTADLSYDRSEFRAYRKLGYELTKQYLATPGLANSLGVNGFHFRSLE